MKRLVRNAFTRNTSGSAFDSPVQIRSLRAELSETMFGWALEMRPMRAADAAVVWPQLSRNPLAQTLLFDLEQSVWIERAGALNVSEIVDRLALEPIARFDDRHVVLDDHRLQQVLSLVSTTRMRMVRIDGPVEPLDAEAIGEALRAGRSPLLAELRASAAMNVLRDRLISLHTRTRRQALTLVAENFRQYLAVRLNRPAGSLAAPALAQLERLLDVSGTITVRPIETELLSTMVDVGVSTTAGEEAGPARCSLIYDLPSDTWHDEP